MKKVFFLLIFLVNNHLYSAEADIESGLSSHRRSLSVYIPSPIPEESVISMENMEIPSAPTLHPVQAVEDLPGLVLDGRLGTEEERMAQFAVRTYFHQRQVSQHILVPLLRQRIRQATDSPVAHEREGIVALRRLMAGQPVSEERLLRCLQDLVLNATSEALQLVEKDAYANRLEIKKRLTKRRAACYAALSGTAIALIGATATLLVHFTQHC